MQQSLFHPGNSQSKICVGKRTVSCFASLKIFVWKLPELSFNSIKALVLKTEKTNLSVVFCLNCGAKLSFLGTEGRARVETWKKVSALK